MNELTMTNILIQSLIALFACVGYAIICNAPRKELPFCGLNGFLGWFVYLIVYEQRQQAVAATMIAAMAATLVARFLSYEREAPSILYHIPGVLPLVPGAAVYNTMTAALDNMILETYSYALNGLKLAGAIGIGSLLVLIVPYQFFAIFPRFGKKKTQ